MSASQIDDDLSRVGARLQTAFPDTKERLTFGVPVCPHAGGVGLPEHVQHLSLIDFICISASLEGRNTEYVDHLHEHFIDPPRIRNGRYMPPTQPG